MKTKEALRIIDGGWIKKPKGFRIHFQRKVQNEFVTDYIPGMKDKPLSSDVVAWRLAWKLFETTKCKGSEIEEDDFVNIYAVDDSGNPIPFYATGEQKIYNPKGNDEAGRPKSE